MITFSLLLLNLPIVLPESVDIILGDLDLILVEINMIADVFNVALNLLRLALNCNHFLLLKFNALLQLVELVNERINSRLMSLLLLAKLLGHGADLLLVLLELLLSLLLLDVEFDQLFLFVWQSLLVVEVFLNELALFTLDVLDRFLGLVNFGDVVLHVIADLDVGLLQDAEFIGKLLLALVSLVLCGHEDTDLLD